MMMMMMVVNNTKEVYEGARITRTRTRSQLLRCKKRKRITPLQEERGDRKEERNKTKKGFHCRDGKTKNFVDRSIAKPYLLILFAALFLLIKM
mgnify:CR=1 FL=1